MGLNQKSFILIFSIFIGTAFSSSEECFNYLKVNNYEKAIKEGKSSLRWDKYDFNPNMCVATAYIKMGIPKKAIPYLKNAISQANTSYQKSVLYNLLGVSYNMSGDWEKAILAYAKSYKYCKKINDKIGMLDNLNNIANIFYVKGFYDEAIEYYKKILKSNLNQDNVTVYNNIALCYANKKDYKKALEYYNKAREEAKLKNNTLEEGVADLNLGVLYLKSFNFKEAKKYLEEGKSLVNGNKYWSSVANEYMAWYYDNKGEKDKAITFYKEALKLAKKVGAKDIEKSVEKELKEEENG